jgi:hypothetical protein
LFKLKESYSRREILGLSGTALAGSLAGCTGGGEVDGKGTIRDDKPYNPEADFSEMSVLEYVEQDLDEGQHIEVQDAFIELVGKDAVIFRGDNNRKQELEIIKYNLHPNPGSDSFSATAYEPAGEGEILERTGNEFEEDPESILQEPAAFKGVYYEPSNIGFQAYDEVPMLELHESDI